MIGLRRRWPHSRCARTASAEYEDPLNRRFHAQPNACPVCGPHLELLPSAGHPALPIWDDMPDDEIEASARSAAGGAYRGDQGDRRFPSGLRCDQFRRRARTAPPQRPCRQTVRGYDARPGYGLTRFCEVSYVAAQALNARERPIVLLPLKPEYDHRAGSRAGPDGTWASCCPIRRCIFAAGSRAGFPACPGDDQWQRQRRTDCHRQCRRGGTSRPDLADAFCCTTATFTSAAMILSSVRGPGVMRAASCRCAVHGDMRPTRFRWPSRRRRC